MMKQLDMMISAISPTQAVLVPSMCTRFLMTTTATPCSGPIAKPARIAGSVDRSSL